MRPRQAGLPPTDTLATFLERLYWNPAERGLLLIIAPEYYRRQTQPNAPPPSFSRGVPTTSKFASNKATFAEGGPLNPAQILPEFGAQVLRFEGISVVAPERMFVFHPRPLPLNDGSRVDFLGLSDLGWPFLASLSAEQCQALLGSGLAISRLKEDQKALLIKLVPTQGRLQFTGVSPFPSDAKETPVLPPGVLESGQLQLRQTLSLTGFASGKKDSEINFQDATPTEVTTQARQQQVVTLRPGPDLRSWQEVINPFDIAPARTKPRALNLDTSARVSLEGASDVQTLVQRLATATQLPLLCDRRLGAHSVVMRGGGSVRAGELLKALCRGLNASVRRVGSVFLFTEDQETTRELEEKQQQVRVLNREKNASAKFLQTALDKIDARRKLIQNKFLSTVPRKSGSLAPESLWKLAWERGAAPADSEEDEDKDPPSLAIGLLPESLQKTLVQRVQREEAAARQRTPPALEPIAMPDRVSADLELELRVNLPTLGAHFTLRYLSASEIHPDKKFASGEPVVWPEDLKTRALLVQLPKSLIEIESLVGLAKQAQVTELRVPVGASEEEVRILMELGKKAKTAGFGVRPVLSPLTPLQSTTPRETSLLGRTLLQHLKASKAWGGYMNDPSLTELLLPLDMAIPELLDLRAFAERARRLRALPGITGISLRDIAFALGGATYGWEASGGLERRLAFLKREQLDLADLDDVRGAWTLSNQPSTPVQAMLRTRWEALQFERRTLFLTRLHKALKEAGLEAVDAEKGHFQVTRRWEQLRPGFFLPGDDNLLGIAPLVAAGRPALGVVQKTLWPFFWQYAPSGTELLDEVGRLRFFLNQSLRDLLKEEKEKKLAGAILDLSDQPLPEALATLTSAFGKSPLLK
ncbi:hypothetical protein [Armatimonas sp.]|uniref:hypothetical protein n=1 Tax=Armatimonas sp. TaxID=1872638 RepID=UPI00286D311A|nr:hypothetical protein [Armatimonas sp.]